MVGYHLKAAPILQQLLQVEVKGYDTLCAFQIKGMSCEVFFKFKPSPDVFKCEEALITMSMPGAPKTPQTYKRLVVAIDENDTIAQACMKVSETVLRTTGVKTIIVKHQDKNWCAFIEEKSFVNAIGQTAHEALGNLVHNNPEEFGVQVEVKL